MISQRDIVKKVAQTHGGHIITGAQSIFEAPDPHIARFDLNENLFGPSPKVVDTIRNFVEKVGVNWYNAWLRNPCQEAIAKYAVFVPATCLFAMDLLNSWCYWVKCFLIRATN